MAIGFDILAIVKLFNLWYNIYSFSTKGGDILPIVEYQPLKCSFCGKSEREVAKLLVSSLDQKTSMCDLCVRVAVEMIEPPDHERQTTPQPRGKK